MYMLSLNIPFKIRNMNSCWCSIIAIIKIIYARLKKNILSNKGVPYVHTKTLLKILLNHRYSEIKLILYFCKIESGKHIYELDVKARLLNLGNPALNLFT